MQIKQFSMENFQGIQRDSFEPEKLVAFLGDNGAGKTSHLEAIRFLLTGEAPDTPIRTGAAEAVVCGELSGIGVIERSVTAKGKKCRVNGRATTQKSINELMESTCKVKMDAAKVITASKILAQMKAGDLSEFLVSSGLIPVTMDMKKLLHIFPVSEAARSELSMLLPPSPQTFGLEELDEAYSLCYSSRASLKKELAAAKAKAVYEGEPPKYSMKSIDAKMVELTAKAQLKKQQQKQMEAYLSACKRYETAKAQLADLSKKIKETSVKQPDEKELEFLEKRLAAEKEAVYQRESSIAVFKQNIILFQQTLDRLATPICPLSEKLVCKTDKTQIRQELEGSINKNKAEMEKLESEQKKSNELIVGFNEKIQQFRQQMQAYQQMKNLYDKYQFLSKNMPVIPEKPEEIEEDKDLKAKMDWLTAQKNLILQYQQAKKYAKEAQSIQDRIAVMEELVELLHPKRGIREKVIAFALEPLVKYCNEKAKKLRLYFEIKIEVEDGVHILCQTKETSGFLDLSSVSSGEQLYAVFLITDMLNALSGYGVLILDDLDKLDENSFEALIGLLLQKEIMDSYDHVFLAAAKHPDIEKSLKAHKEIQVFDL